MKKIAIIALSFGWLPGEGGTTRFSYLAELLAGQGHDVTLISSSFYHVKKRERDIADLTQKEYPFHLFFLHEPGYKKNVCLQRVLSHYIAAKNLKQYLRNKNFDLIYCVIPPNDLAKTAAVYAKKKKIPFIIDIEDLWPEGWQTAFGKHKILDFVFYPIRKDAEKAYKCADGVIGTSDEYTSRAFKRQTDKKKKIPYKTVYVCIDLNEFDSGAAKHGDEIKKSNNEFWVTYAGTLGESYDIGTMILAAQELKHDGFDHIKFNILGTGPLKGKWEKAAAKMACNVTFYGFVPYPKMAAFLEKSDIVLNSFVKKAAQSIVTKIGDYLASGNPMINTCSSFEFRKKVEKDGFGLNVEAENCKKLKDAILFLYNNRDTGKEMGKKGRIIAEKEFDRKSAYMEIVQMVESFL